MAIKEKQVIAFDSYLSDIGAEFAAHAQAVHDNLTQAGCMVTLKEAKSGHVVSFTHKPTKKVVANLVARKGKSEIRIYADNYAGYLDAVKALPQSMLNAVKGSPNCSRLVDPTKCNGRCPLGYTMEIDATIYKKCRYGAFMFKLDEESLPHILTLLDSEVKGRDEK